MITLDKGFGREIVVDVVNAKGNVPLGFEVDTRGNAPKDFEQDHPTNLQHRRMPVGNFGIKIFATSPTVVRVHLDGVLAIEKQIDKGLTTLTSANDGGQLVFTGEGFRTYKPVERRQDKPKTVNDNPELVAVTEPVTATPAPERVYAPSKGLVIVELAIAPGTPFNSPELPPDDFAPVLFQLNAPGVHYGAMATQLSRVVRPDDSDTVSDLAGTESQPAHKRAHRSRICTCCQDR